MTTIIDRGKVENHPLKDLVSLKAERRLTCRCQDHVWCGKGPVLSLGMYWEEPRLTPVCGRASILSRPNFGVLCLTTYRLSQSRLSIF